METPPVESAHSAEETSTQKQVRLRRERREAKIKAGGSARLERITNLSGRPAEPAPPPNTAFPAAQSSNHRPFDDPEEIDITNHPFTSRSPPPPQYTQNEPSQADLHQFLRTGGIPSNMTNNPFAGPGIPGHGEGGDGGGGNEDPMMRMLQQMMGGMPGGGGGGMGDPNSGFPPALAAMLGGGGTGPENTASAQQEDSAYGYMWTVIHALFAFSLGIYATCVTPYNGSRLARSTVAGITETLPVQFFWVFATAELVLQSTRYFLEKGKSVQRGILWTVSGFLPDPWRGYVGLVSRYSGIYTRLVEDAMAIVFVLGVVAWWHGVAAG